MKRTNLWIWSVLLLFCLVACNSEQKTSKTKKVVEEIPAEGQIRNSDIIRNPITAGGTLDTNSIAKFSFTETTFDFGTVKEGAEVKHTFEFTNIGKAPLLISDARSTCGCTVPQWPENAIPPGGSGSIDVVFKTAGKQNKQQKPVTISANTYPPSTVIYLKGNVTPKPEK